VTFAVAAALALLTVGTSSTDRQAEEKDILEAVFRQQILELTAPDAHGRSIVLCLAHDPGGAPQSVDREMLRRFPGETVLRRAAECEVRAARVVEIATGRAALLVTAGPIERVKDDEVWVTVEQRLNRGHSTRRDYRVVREAARWISLGPIFRDTPA